MTVAVDGVFLHVVICTYNRCNQLEETLRSLVGQSALGMPGWAVLVVDNNCTDATSDVVQRYVGKIPGLSRVTEGRQGLTEARQCGVHSTQSPWIAYVDDDCVLADNWVAEAMNFCHENPDAAGFNGLNQLVLDGEREPPWVHPLMFAGYFPNASGPQKAGFLHGAGMVLRRKSLLRSGWLQQPRAQDRRGNSLVSGGDNELAIRTRAGGGELWYVPACVLTHRITEDRLRMGYLCRLNYRIAESKPALRLMVTGGQIFRWHIRMLRGLGGGVLRTFGLLRNPMSHPGAGWRGWLLGLCRACGFTIGYLSLVVSNASRRELHGLATAAYVDSLNSQS